MLAGHQVGHVSADVIVGDMLSRHLDKALLTQDELHEVVVVLLHGEAEVLRHGEMHVGAELLDGIDDRVPDFLCGGLCGQTQLERVGYLTHLGSLNVVEVLYNVGESPRAGDAVRCVSVCAESLADAVADLNADVGHAAHGDVGRQQHIVSGLEIVGVIVGVLEVEVDHLHRLDAERIGIAVCLGL